MPSTNLDFHEHFLRHCKAVSAVFALLVLRQPMERAAGVDLLCDCPEIHSVDFRPILRICLGFQRLTKLIVFKPESSTICVVNDGDLFYT